MKGTKSTGKSFECGFLGDQFSSQSWVTLGKVRLQRLKEDWSLAVFTHGGLSIIDSGWTQTQVNIGHGGRNRHQICQTGRLRGLETGCISAPIEPIALKSSRGCLKKMARVHLHCKHVLRLVVEQMVSPLSAP